MSERVLHMIGNAHIDPVWLWQWPEGYQEARDVPVGDRPDGRVPRVRLHLRLGRLPAVDRGDPELFAKIRERVAEGRFQVFGGWWVEPDCNIPCGESYVRQALYGQRWLHDRFEVTATTKATSTRSATTRCCRSSSARAGSTPTSSSGRARTARAARSVLLVGVAGRLASAHTGSRTSTAARAATSTSTSRRRSRRCRREGPALMVFYGVGNHGGGPTKANIESIRRLSKSMNGTPRVEFSGRSSTLPRTTTFPSTRTSCSTTRSAAIRRTRA